MHVAGWFGHVKGMPGKKLPRRIVEWEPEKTGREEKTKRKIN
jgi:hypothetical protein